MKKVFVEVLSFRIDGIQGLEALFMESIVAVEEIVSCCKQADQGGDDNEDPAAQP